LWEDLYAELKNKIRWSISTSMGGQYNMSFRASDQAAKPLAQLLLDGIKLKNDAPDLDLGSWIAKEIESKGIDKS